MSNFIQRSDYLSRIRDKHLIHITDSETTPSNLDDILDEAEETAIAIVEDSLYSRYDIEDIFSKTGTERARQVVRWVTSLVIYYIYERIPDKLTPNRVKDNYTDTIETLKSIEDGTKSTNLKLKINEEEKTVSKFRWGSEPRRQY